LLFVCFSFLFSFVLRHILLSKAARNIAGQRCKLQRKLLFFSCVFPPLQEREERFRGRRFIGTTGHAVRRVDQSLLSSGLVQAQWLDTTTRTVSREQYEVTFGPFAL
jgi:hypothetical protein